MGSFNDLIVHPSTGHNVAVGDVDEVNGAWTRCEEPSAVGLANSSASSGFRSAFNSARTSNSRGGRGRCATSTDGVRRYPITRAPRLPCRPPRTGTTERVAPAD